MPKLWNVRLSWIVVALLLLAAGRAEAQSVTLAWDPNDENDLAGYIIGYGTSSGQNQKTVDVGMATQWSVGGLSAGKTYYFRVFAYNTAGTKSAPSKEVSTTMPGSGPSSGGCTGSAPVAGWVCQNGGWVPPELAGGGSEPAPPLPTSTGCTGSAPSTGWVCLNGGWLPPDSPALWNSPAPSPVGVCSGPDPFAGLGGGSCYNGGWLPPGMPVPGGTTAAPTPAPSTKGCSTPDPFGAHGGGTCYNGGWLPPGMPVPSGGCMGASPGVGWVCQDGGWLPPDHPLVNKKSGGD